MTNPTNTQDTALVAAAAGYTPCKCSTGCPATTRNLFSQGHDARMVSRLVGQIVDANLPGAEPFTLEQAVTELRQRGGTSALETKLRNATAKAFDRWTKQAEAKARKAAGKARGAQVVTEVAPEPTPEPVREVISAKVGRWVYSGHLINGEFTYKNAKLQMVTTTKFTRI